MVKDAICAVSYATHKVNLNVTACKVKVWGFHFICISMWWPFIPKYNALLKCTKIIKNSRNCNGKHIIWQAKHVCFFCVCFIDSSLLFFFFFFLNPQFHISHYYVRSASSATNSSRLLKKGSNPDLLSTSPISLDDIYEFKHFWWTTNKSACWI